MVLIRPVKSCGGLSLTLDSAYNDALEAARSFALVLRVVDRTDNTLTMLIEIDVDLVVNIYINTKKSKLNMALVWQRRRIFGVDREGGVLHMHPIEAPEAHITTERKIDIQVFLSTAMQYLEEKQIL